jgi:predicted RND superfamily exporter protein
VRWAGLPIHAYNAFVIPVLLGITVDEAMFLIFRARAEREGGLEAVLQHEGPNVLATGVTTAAGFAGLLACTFDGLRDMGRLGVLGVMIGLLSALWAVPVGLRCREPAKHG